MPKLFQEQNRQSDLVDVVMVHSLSSGLSLHGKSMHSGTSMHTPHGLNDCHYQCQQLPAPRAEPGLLLLFVVESKASVMFVSQKALDKILSPSLTKIEVNRLHLAHGA